MRLTLLAAARRSGWAQMWSHSPGFAGVREDPSVTVSPGHGRWRTPVNAGQHCWKACWGQPLRSSNLLSSATSDQAIHQAGHEPVRPRSLICGLFHSAHIGIKRPKGAGARFGMLSRLWPLTGATGPVGPGAVTGHRVKVHRAPPAHRDRSVPGQRTRPSRIPRWP